MEPSNAKCPEAKERKLVWLLSGLAAIHVFVYAAAVPFYSNVDEQAHFDLVLKYSHGHLPHGLEPLARESCRYLQAYGSPEFIASAKSYPDDRYPAPFWTKAGAANMSHSALTYRQATSNLQELKGFAGVENYESGQQPLYYWLTGSWCRLGQRFGLVGLHLIYWLRFLNILFAVALVRVAYAAARLVFPDSAFLRTLVVSVTACLPSHSFYLIGNDVLSPITFGIAFICLVRFWQADRPGIRLGVGTGLALAVVFLQKLSNAPLLAVSGVFLTLKIFQLWRDKKLRAPLPALAWLFICAGVPVAAWLVWTKCAFGDFAGTAAKLHFLTWTRKPFHEWWHHPMFTPSGFWTFMSALIITFWQGELWWHGQPLTLPVVDAVYVIASLGLILLGFVSLVPKFAVTTPAQRHALLFGFAAWISGGILLGWLSIGYDFGMGGSPSREYPFFTAGRLMLGGLVPFLLFCASGVRFLLRDLKAGWVRPTVLLTVILFLLVSEIATYWTVFPSQYNWYHL